MSINFVTYGYTDMNCKIKPFYKPYFVLIEKFDKPQKLRYFSEHFLPYNFVYDFFLFYKRQSDADCQHRKMKNMTSYSSVPDLISSSVSLDIEKGNCMNRITF